MQVKTLSKGVKTKISQNRKLNQIDKDEKYEYAEKISTEISHLDSQQIENTINKHLHSIYSVCTLKNRPQPKKWNQLISSVDDLNLYLNKILILEERLSENSWGLLQDISNNVSSKVLGYKDLTNTAANCRDLHQTFLIKYRLYYNLKDNSTIRDFPDDWAQKIYKSLACACKE